MPEVSGRQGNSLRPRTAKIESVTPRGLCHAPDAQIGRQTPECHKVSEPGASAGGRVADRRRQDHSLQLGERDRHPELLGGTGRARLPRLRPDRDGLHVGRTPPVGPAAARSLPRRSCRAARSGPEFGPRLGAGTASADPATARTDRGVHRAGRSEESGVTVGLLTRLLHRGQRTGRDSCQRGDVGAGGQAIGRRVPPADGFPRLSRRWIEVGTKSAGRDPCWKPGPFSVDY